MHTENTSFGSSILIAQISMSVNGVFYRILNFSWFFSSIYNKTELHRTNSITLLSPHTIYFASWIIFFCCCWLVGLLSLCSKHSFIIQSKNTDTYSKFVSNRTEIPLQMVQRATTPLVVSIHSIFTLIIKKRCSWGRLLHLSHHYDWYIYQVVCEILYIRLYIIWSAR